MSRSFLIVLLIGLTWFYSITGLTTWDAYWILKLPTMEPLFRFIVFYIVSAIFVIAWVWKKE